MTRKNSSKFNNKKGFTLAELLTVVGITAILAAIGIIALVRYSNALKLTQMDNSAKEIFIAAQNHLSTSESSGSLGDLVKESETDKSLLGTKMDVRPSDMSKSEWESNGDDYYYVVYDPDKSSELKTGVLTEMLPYGSVDDDIRKSGYYIIEYNVKTANIYGVFYNESGRLTGTDENTSGSYLNSTADRVRPEDSSTAAKDAAKDNRLKYNSAKSGKIILGYYGGAMVDLFGKNITSPTLKVDNGSRLKVTITDPNYYDEAGKDGDTKQLKTGITLKVKGTESKNTKTLVLALADAADGADPVKADSSQTFWSVRKITTDDNKSALQYTVYLDDITSHGGHFSEICDNLIPGENIVLTAKCSSGSVLTNVKSSHKGYTNSLYADVKADKDVSDNYEGTATAEVSNIRHLENLDPLISKLPQKTLSSPADGKHANSNPYIITDVLQTANINYDTFFDDVKGSDGSFSIYKDGALTATSLISNGFYGIYNYNIASYDGNGKTISNMKANNTVTSSGEVSGMNSALFRLIAENIEIRDLTIKDSDITANKNAAGLVAEIQTNDSHKPSNVTIKNVLVDGGKFKSTINTGNSGGLIGYAKTQDQLTVTNCAASAYCESEYGDAGGFIAEIGAKTTLTNCYSGGHTHSGKYSSSDYNVIAGTSVQNSSNSCPSAGGFLGKTGGASNITIHNCYSTCSAKGYYSGGFIGSDIYNGSNKSYTYCYSTGLVSGTKAGCFGGEITRSTFTYDYYLDGINSDSTDGIGSTSGNTGNVYAASANDSSIADSSSGRETHPFDSTLGSYPFRMVNHVGAVYSSSKGVHYGDWQDLGEKTDVAFAYRETDSGGSTSWKLINAGLNSSGNVTTSTSGSLMTSKGKTITNYDYGLLTYEKLNLNSMSKGSDDPKAINFYDAPQAVSVNGHTMYYYKVKSSVTSRFSTSSNYMNTPKFYLGSGKSSKYVQFSFNPLFAAAMSRSGSYSFGTAKNPYQVRTAWHFSNIIFYPSKYYDQTCDIDMSADSFTRPVVYGTFSGNYNAKYSGDTGYSISGLKETISDDSYESVGLFQANTGTISYLTLEDSNIKVSVDSENIGAIAGTNSTNGKLLNCSTSNVNISVEPPYVWSHGMSIGGLVGTNSPNAAITDCSADGSIGFKATYGPYNKQNISTGGLVGTHGAYTLYTNTAKITDCSANVKIDTDYISYGDGSAYTGGFAGWLDNGDVIGCSSTSTITDTEDYPGVADAYEYIGGFAGYADGNNPKQVISNCWSRTSMSSQSDVVFLGGFLGGKTSAYPEISNCYAATYFADDIDGYVAGAGLFTGRDLCNDVSRSNYYYCHAAQRSAADKDTLVLSEYGFLNSDALNAKTNSCYVCSDADVTTYGGTDLSVNDYKTLSNFSGLGTGTWELTNGNYPTLKDNPEK